MARAPLPKLKSPVPQVVKLKELTPAQVAERSALRQKAKEIRASVNPVAVPESLNEPLPLIKMAEQRLKRRDGWADKSGLRAAPDEVLHFNVTITALDRALLLVDVLLKELIKHSIIATIDRNEKKTILDVGGTSVTLTITEKIRRDNHQATLAETKARDKYYAQQRSGNYSGTYPHIPHYDYHATGQLTTTAGHYPSRNWKDTERTPLEKRIGEIVVGIIDLAAEIKAIEAERAREEEQRRLAWERYNLKRNRLEAEQARFKKLDENASKWEHANRLRTYIDTVENRALAEGTLTAELADWIAWARAKADWIDPLIKVCDPILDAPAPKEPSRW